VSIDTMCTRIRVFSREFQVNNFVAATIRNNKVIPKKRTPRQIAQLIAEVCYTPRGWRIDLHQLNEFPIHVWDEEHTKKLYGITAANPDGSMRNANYLTMRAAMQAITRKLKQLGWEPEDEWQI